MNNKHFQVGFSSSFDDPSKVFRHTILLDYTRNYQKSFASSTTFLSKTHTPSLIQDF